MRQILRPWWAKLYVNENTTQENTLSSLYTLRENTHTHTTQRERGDRGRDREIKWGDVEWVNEQSWCEGECKDIRIPLCPRLITYCLVHCWNYRRHCIRMAESPSENELDYTLKLIHKNFSNYSAWHQRSLLLPKIYDTTQGFSQAAEEGCSLFCLLVRLFLCFLDASLFC